MVAGLTELTAESSREAVILWDLIVYLKANKWGNGFGVIAAWLGNVLGLFWLVMHLGGVSLALYLT